MSEQTKAETKPATKAKLAAKKTKLYWVHPVIDDTGNPPKVFGRTGEVNKAGHLVVEIQAAQVKNELGRAGRRFLNGTEYKEWLSQSE